jgi:DNA-binding transcriptional LysR family regulator
MQSLRHLAAFIQAAERGSFAAASDALGLTASGVSKSVAALEADLGVRLLQRSGKGVLLTDEGQRFMQRAKAIEDEYRNAQREVRPAGAAITGRLRVVLHHAPCRISLTPRLVEFCEQYPGIDLQAAIVDGYTDLEKAGADMGVVSGVPPEAPGLVARRLSRGATWTCASAGYLARAGRPRHPNDLQEHRALLMVSSEGRINNAWRYIKDDEELEIAVRPTLILNDGPALSACAVADKGIVYFPAVAMQPYVARGALVRILEDWASPGVPIFALIAPGRRSLPQVRAFMTFLEQHYRDQQSHVQQQGMAAIDSARPAPRSRGPVTFPPSNARR